MIITRSPLRISLGGGGTDLPSYYREHSGFVISAAIDKYVYITLHDTFEQQFIIKYSKTELVQSVEEIKHPCLRPASGSGQYVGYPGRHRAGLFRQFHGSVVARPACAQ
jgi:galactokinase/mevalonate kinase-like predicted kinase